jgi:hypothetical protein
VVPDGVDRELAPGEPVQVLAVDRHAGAQGHEGVTDEAVVRSRASSSLLVYGRIAATMRPAPGETPRRAREVILDRLPRGEQQQLEQHGLDRAPCRATVEVCFLPGGLGVIEAP